MNLDIACALFLLAGLAGPAATPATAESVRIDDCQYPDDTVAQAVWHPMSGTAPVTVASRDGRRALRLTCQFAGTQTARASWDRPAALDLASCRGIQFEVCCPDSSPISSFSVYFQSGAGWYHATFYPESATGWNTIRIEKTRTTTEGTPAGWAQVKTIRISAWRGKDADTEFFLRDLRKIGVLGVDTSVAILRGESATQRQPEEAAAAAQYAEAVGQSLSALGLGATMLSDLDLTDGRLQAAKLVILPHNPRLPDSVADALITYARDGGKLLAFYTLPERLYPVFQVKGGAHVKASSPGFFSAIRFVDGALPGAPPVVGQQSWNINALEPIPGRGRVLAEWLDRQGQPNGYAAVLGSSNALVMTHVLLPDDASNKHRMLLAMVGYLVPEIWSKASAASLADIGVIAGYASFEEASAQIAALGDGKARVQQALAEARALRALAEERAAQQKHAEAMDQARAARQRTLEAYCLAQSPEQDEFRAFWCHSAFGVSGLTWDQAIGRLAENGFTAIVPNMLWGGVAFFDSKILPVAPQVAERGDQIAQCLAAGRKHHVQVHVWKVNWNLGHAAPAAWISQLRQEGRLQASSQGVEKLWLCPSHPDNQTLEIASMVEVVQQYEVDGIHFDYIRYPDGNHCFCSGCRERFQRVVKAPVRNWPQDTLEGGPLRQAWLNWRRGHITAVVQAVHDQARALKPDIQLSAAVFRNWTSDRDSVAQDWKLWCEEGYLDFVCPMDYTPSNRSFESMVSQQVQWAGQTRCYPGIGVSASSSSFGPDRVIEQIQITRRHRTGGFIIFNYGATESQDLLPLLGLGITARR